MPLNVAARAAGLRKERILSSPRFRDGVFHNTAPVGPGLKPNQTLPTLGEYFFGKQARVPAAPLPTVDPRSTWQRAPGTLRATWLGHSTVLLELGGARLLTDPVWSDRASPLAFAGPRRFQPVPVAIDALPALDAVLLTHDHYDHLDAAAVRALATQRVPFITSLGVGKHLERFGVPHERITELEWWESVELRGGDVRVTAGPAQHFSGRGLSDRNATAWSSFVVESAHARVFFSGDTGLTSEYAELRARFGRFDLAMLEVGAFHEAWGDIHLGPRNALEALRLLGDPLLLPVHWGTFNLALHAWDEPAETLFTTAATTGQALAMPLIGGSVELTALEPPTPWWRTLATQPVAAALPEPSP